MSFKTIEWRIKQHQTWISILRFPYSVWFFFSTLVDTSDYKPTPVSGWISRLWRCRLDFFFTSIFLVCFFMRGNAKTKGKKNQLGYTRKEESKKIAQVATVTDGLTDCSYNSALVRSRKEGKVKQSMCTMCASSVKETQQEQDGRAKENTSQ